MTLQWIDAATARRIVADGGSLGEAERLICVRTHAKMINSRAAVLRFGEETKQNCNVPAEFWWAEGEAALAQNWETGDFSTWLEQRMQIQAFGVQFALDDVLAFLPTGRRALIARTFSVESNPDWLSARDARALIVEKERLEWRAAQSRIADLAGLGFVAARAVQMSRLAARSTRPTIEREWDIPTWFWADCLKSSNAKADWTLGSFGGSHFIGGHWTRFDLASVHFLRETLVPVSDAAGSADDDTGFDGAKTRLPEASLLKWWDSKLGVRDSLSIDELLNLARAKFPDNHVARDRIRALARGRKRGPKA